MASVCVKGLTTRKGIDTITASSPTGLREKQVENARHVIDVVSIQIRWQTLSVNVDIFFKRSVNFVLNIFAVRANSNFRACSSQQNSFSNDYYKIGLNLRDITLSVKH